MSAKKTISVKIVIIGEPAVGKTTLRINFIGQGMEGDYLMTLGVDMAQAEIEIDHDLSLDTQIWDIAGQDSLEQITNQFLAGTQGAIFVFDLTRDYTFDKINSWLDRLHLENPELENNIPFIIVGNKSDLESHIKMEDNVVTEYLEYVNRHQVYSKTPTEYVKTSAKTGDRVKEAFLRLGQTILLNFKELGDTPEVDSTKISKLEESLVDAKTVEEAKPVEPLVKKPVGLPTGPPPRAPEPIVETPVVEETKVQPTFPSIPDAPPPRAPEPIVETPVVEETKVQSTFPSIPDAPSPEPIVETPVIEETKVQPSIANIPSAPSPEPMVETPVIEKTKVQPSIANIPSAPSPEPMVKTPVVEETKVQPSIANIPSAPSPEPMVETPVVEETKVQPSIANIPSAPSPEPMVETPVIEETKIEETILKETKVEMHKMETPRVEKTTDKETSTQNKSDEIDDLVKEIMDETEPVKKKSRFRNLFGKK